MSSPTAIPLERLSRLIGRPDCPLLVDVRTDDDFAADPRLIPGSVRRRPLEADQWAPGFAGSEVVVICHKGLKLSEGVAAWLRHAGAAARHLEGGAAGWARAGLPMAPSDRIPARRAGAGSVWVTRARPKIDRIACPWLIRRFIDRDAVFLFVSTPEAMAVADRFGATPFDIEGPDVFWSHRGDLCTFDVMIAEFGLSTAPLLRLAQMVRGADTARLDLAPEAAGLLAVSLGLSRMFSDDLKQLDAGMLVYDALFRWCADATAETHHWPGRAAALAAPALAGRA